MDNSNGIQRRCSVFDCLPWRRCRDPSAAVVPTSGGGRPPPSPGPLPPGLIQGPKTEDWCLPGPKPAFLAKHQSSGHYGQADRWTLFAPDGPQASSVLQGGLGDCFLMASLAALAYQDPDFVRSMIRDLGQGVYSVRLYAPNHQGQYSEQWVVVDSAVPLGSTNQPLYGRVFRPVPRGTAAIWPVLVEKAIVRLNDEYHIFSKHLGYQGIGQGGNRAVVLQVLTGQSTGTLNVAQEWYCDEDVWQVVARADQGDYVTAATWKAVPGLPADHSYTILGTEWRGNERRIKLRNPWGAITPDNRFGGDGLFSLPMSTFRAHFEYVVSAPRCSTR